MIRPARVSARRAFARGAANTFVSGGGHTSVLSGRRSAK